MKKRQIAVLVLVVIIIVAGYLQYNYDKKGYSSLQTNTDTQNNNEKIGEAIYVDNSNVTSKGIFDFFKKKNDEQNIEPVQETDKENKENKENNENNNNTNSNEPTQDNTSSLNADNNLLIEDETKEVFAGQNEYFAQARLEKSRTRGQEEEILRNITKDDSAAKDIKNKAYEKLMNVVNNNEIEMKIESLIKQRGFDDAIAYLSQDGSVDVVINSTSLTSSQTAQICDIVQRHAGISIENIHIKNVSE